MDVDQVTASANKVNNMAGQLQTLIGQLNAQVVNLRGIWTGSDSNAFVDQTWPAHKSNLDRCKSDLDGLVSDLKKEIQQQITTSQS